MVLKFSIHLPFRMAHSFWHVRLKFQSAILSDMLLEMSICYSVWHVGLEFLSTILSDMLIDMSICHPVWHVDRNLLLLLYLICSFEISICQPIIWHAIWNLYLLLYLACYLKILSAILSGIRFRPGGARERGGKLAIEWSQAWGWLDGEKLVCVCVGSACECWFGYGSGLGCCYNLESRGPHLAGEEKSWNAMNAGHKRYKFMVMTIRLGRERIVTGTNWEPERTWNGRLAIGRCRQLASQIVA